jgi:hypothetical protein
MWGIGQRGVGYERITILSIGKYCFSGSEYEQFSFPCHGDGIYGYGFLSFIQRKVEMNQQQFDDLCTAPPPSSPRQWVGLTKDEIIDAIAPLYQTRKVAEMAAEVSIDDFRAIEAKLKEKNAWVNMSIVLFAIHGLGAQVVENTQSILVIKDLIA